MKLQKVESRQPLTSSSSAVDGLFLATADDILGGDTVLFATLEMLAEAYDPERGPRGE